VRLRRRRSRLPLNPACEALFGWSEAEVLGHEAKFIPDDRIDEFIDIGARVFSGEVVRGFETQRLRRDGTLVDVSISVAPIFSRDGTAIRSRSVRPGWRRRSTMRIAASRSL
jgi:PAS domain S-box-containing protein